MNDDNELAADRCPWCMGTGFVHTSDGELGDLIAGPALCGHDGRWRQLTDTERAAPKTVAALARLHTQAALVDRSLDTRDFTEPQIHERG